MDNTPFPESNSSLGFIGILKESFKTIRKNMKLLVPILLSVFLLSPELQFSENYLLVPTAKDFVLQLTENPKLVHDLIYNIDQKTYDGVLNNVQELLVVKLFLIAFSFFISLFFFIATVSSSYEAYTAKVLSPKDLFLKVIKVWKRPLVTSFYMLLITLGIICFYFISIGITIILAVNSWAFLVYGVFSFLILIFCFYMSTLWMVSVIVSVIEDGVDGFKAIGRAVELMNGKKLQASLMMGFFVVSHGGVHLIVNAIVSYDLSMNMQMSIMISFIKEFICFMELFMFVVFTVFYHERKMIHDEKKVKGLYLPVIAGEG